MAYIKYNDLSLPKYISEPNHWADHIELFCFLSNDGYFSEQQIIDRLLDENSNDSLAAVEDVADEEEIDELTKSLAEVIVSDAIVDTARDDSAQRDKISSKVSTFFTLLKSREKHFEGDYPFIVGRNDIVLKENLDNPQKLYVILLCSSLLRLATKPGVNKLGHHFEELCGPAFSKLTVNNSQNYFFGSGGNIENPFTGTFYNKVIQLCNLLHVSETTNFTIENAGVHNVGDGGLDWVSVYDFPDKQFSQPVFFGQCACGSDWVDKEFDAHTSKWKNYIQFGNGYLTYHFIPRNFRNEALEWYNPLDIMDIVLIDRYRLMLLLKDDPNLTGIIDGVYRAFFSEIESNKIDAFS